MKSLVIIISLLSCMQLQAQSDDRQSTDSVVPLVLQILKFPDGSSMLTHSGEIITSDLCGIDVVDSINLAEKYVPYLKNEKSAFVFWVAKGVEPFMTLDDVLEEHHIVMTDTDIVKLNHFRLQRSEFQPLFSRSNIHSVEKKENVISIITKHFLIREELKRQGKTHVDIDKMPSRREFWPTKEELKNREELRKNNHTSNMCS